MDTAVRISPICYAGFDNNPSYENAPVRRCVGPDSGEKDGDIQDASL